MSADFSDAITVDIIQKLLYPRGLSKGGVFLKQFSVSGCILFSWHFTLEQYTS